jgi:hypothetical protein
VQQQPIDVQQHEAVAEIGDDVAVPDLVEQGLGHGVPPGTDNSIRHAWKEGGLRNAGHCYLCISWAKISRFCAPSGCMILAVAGYQSRATGAAAELS